MQRQSSARIDAAEPLVYIYEYYSNISLRATVCDAGESDDLHHGGGSRNQRRLASALAGAGHRVLVLGAAAPDSTAGSSCIPMSFGSRAAVAQGFAKAAQRLGDADLIVHDAMPVMSGGALPMTAQSYAQWNELTHVTVRAALHCLQAAAEHFAHRAGSVLLLGPAMALVGAAGLCR